MRRADVDDALEADDRRVNLEHDAAGDQRRPTQLQ